MTEFEAILRESSIPMIWQAIFSGILSTIVLMLNAHIKTFIETYIWSAKAPSLTIHQNVSYDYWRHTDNIFYEALRYCLMDLDERLSGDMIAEARYMTKSDKRVFPPPLFKIFAPGSGCVAQCKFRGSIIRIKTETAEEAKKREYYYKLELFGLYSSPHLLQEFLDVVVKRYETHTCESRQPYFYQHHDGKWSGTPMYGIKTFANIALTCKSELEDDLEQFWSSQDVYARRGVAWTRGYLFHGPPGTGKSSIIQAISRKYMLDVYSMNVTSIRSDNALTELFLALPPQCMLILEDVDTMKIRRDTTVPVTTNIGELVGISFQGIINALDGVASGHGRIVIMTTNHLDQIDSTIIRPGRIDRIFELAYCTNAMIRELFSIYYEQPFPKSVSFDIESQKWTPAQVGNWMHMDTHTAFIARLKEEEPPAENFDACLVDHDSVRMEE